MNKTDLDERRDTSFLSKLSPMTARAIRALTRSGFAEKALAEQERDLLIERRKLIEQLADVDKRIAVGMPELEAAAAKAAKDVEEAETQLIAKRERVRLASSIHHGAELCLTRERVQVLDALMETSDSRLADFIFHIENIRDGQLPAKLQYWPDEEKRKADALYPISSNFGDYMAAKDALDAVVLKVREAQLRALTSSEVSELLGEICARLAPVLAIVELNPPTLSAASGEVGRPINYHGRSEWIVDEIRDPTREELMAEREQRESDVARASGDRQPRRGGGR